VSAEQSAAFWDNGYLRIEEPITTADELAWFRTIYDEIFQTPKVLRLHFDGEREDGSTGVIGQILGPELTIPEILETTYFANARRIACALLEIDESEITGSGTHMIFKPATAGRDTPWHQDEAYWDQPGVTAHSLSVWMPLDDVTVDSGCMQFLPGSHRSEIIEHRNIGLGEPLVLEHTPDLAGAVACPISAGAATVHHCRTIHYSGPNTSERPRRAISALFHGPVQRRDEPLERTWLPLAPKFAKS
jgi:hypothetical protein